MAYLLSTTKILNVCLCQRIALNLSKCCSIHYLSLENMFTFVSDYVLSLFFLLPTVSELSQTQPSDETGDTGLGGETTATVTVCTCTMLFMIATGYNVVHEQNIILQKCIDENEKLMNLTNVAYGEI